MTTTATELLAAVGEFIEREAQPVLSGRAAFEARVARNALAMLRREQALAPALAALDAKAAVWVGGDSAEPVPVTLARALRDGHLPADQRTLGYLRRRTLTRLAIDNPRYSGFVAAAARWPDDLPEGVSP
ncbi:DUF6285 domain-containing protein [Pseudohaliea rubra]|uniref:DUF6285 domain-containing protein n=1 Tax=Pseudohaliea rubra DSM 19751 TaxID=1265313 RepID=A0A095VSD7_9GAMM|nr:DUF6285 domain-containing protein [Pseudohaliea rubra]KGE04280.1 hypothetical protein HRUBRA_01144 [Pseudohaliea rubra DSM 19751]